MQVEGFVTGSNRNPIGVAPNKLLFEDKFKLVG